jgi:membrane fusion protein (multidrug efflux system)
VANESALAPEERPGRGLDEAAIDVPASERWDVRPRPEEARRPAAPARGRRREERGRTGDAEKDRAKGGDESPDEASRNKRRRWLIIGAAALLVLIGAAWYGVHWYTVGRYLVSTDDAYTEADNVALSPQVAGTIAELDVTDNQRVRRGELIARLDDRTYRAQIDQARADVAAAVANVDNADAQIALQQAVVVEADAAVGSAQAAATFAEEENERYQRLARTGAGTLQRAQQAVSTLRQQRAALVQAQANLAAEQKKLDVLATQREQAEAARQRAAAALGQAQVNLDYCTIVAPIDGVVGDRSARIGQFVATGTRLLTLVPMQDVYVVANYKETQLARMHEGQPVDISVDAYPGRTIYGRVDSLAPGSGAVFALLPPENATGNFTKIVQRVPVKIVIERADPLKGRLRPGLSVEPTVDTRDTRGQKLEERPPQDGVPPPGPQPQPAGAGSS